MSTKFFLFFFVLVMGSAAQADSRFKGPSGQAAFNKVVRAVVNEHFNINGFYPLDENGKPTIDPKTGKPSYDYERYLRRVQYIEELGSHESVGWEPLIHTEYVKGKWIKTKSGKKKYRPGFYQTVYGWFQMRTDTFKNLLAKWKANSSKKGLKLPSFFEKKCVGNDRGKGTGIYSLECQAWIVNWEMAMSDPMRDPRGSNSELHQWGPVNRNLVSWKDAKKDADQEYALALKNTPKLTTQQMLAIADTWRLGKVSLDPEIGGPADTRPIAVDTQAQPLFDTRPIAPPFSSGH